MESKPAIALNRIMQPDLSVTEFVRFAASCSASSIEIRNDLSDSSLLGNEDSASVNRICEQSGIRILTVNALQRFNDPVLLDQKKAELAELITAASKVGCHQIVLCPVNDETDQRSESELHRDLVASLKAYAPLFESNEMVCLVEPLGFAICSLRFKAAAVAAIAESGYDHLYRLVHDTFHHYLSGERELYPEKTGLIHASGVLTGKDRDDVTDDDRIMVDRSDIMDNRGQIAELYQRGYNGAVSFEPFSPAVQQLLADELRSKVIESVSYLFGP